MDNYTTTSLLASIKTRALMPTSQSTFQDSDLITMANEELQLGIVPFILKTRSEYFVTDKALSLVANQDTYAIPTRAIGGKVRGVVLLDSNNNEYDIPQIAKEDRRFYNTNSNNSSYSSFVFYFEGNNAILVPPPASSLNSSVSFSFYQRPNALVATTGAAQISAINTSTNEVTVNTLPSTITTGTIVDFINNSPGFECRGIDYTISGVTGSVLTFSALPSTLAVNDWVAINQQSPIPQIPIELHPMLAQRTAVKVLEALGDQQGVQVAQAKLKEMEEAAIHLLSPRSDSNPKKLINRYSPLRAFGGRGFSRY